MTDAHFILSKKVAKDQIKILENLGLTVSYSYKTNREVGNVLQETCPKVEFSIHAQEEIEMMKDKTKVHFFTHVTCDAHLLVLFVHVIR